MSLHSAVEVSRESVGSPRGKSFPDGLFQTMRKYIADVDCSPYKCQRLADLVEAIKYQWNAILEASQSRSTPAEAPRQKAIDYELNDRQDLLSQLANDLDNVFVVADMTKEEFHLRNQYPLNVSLGQRASDKKARQGRHGCPVETRG